MLPFEYVERTCDYHLECKFCGHTLKPWEQHHIYECDDWNVPKGKRQKIVRVYCPECLVLEPFEKVKD